MSTILSRIKNKEETREYLLNECIPRMSPYDYESTIAHTPLTGIELDFAFHLVLESDPCNELAKKGLDILDVIQRYTRKHPAEIDEIRDTVGSMCAAITMTVTT